MKKNSKYQKCSQKSLRRFVALFMGVKEPIEAFHQTLTFAEEVTEAVAKAKLTKLLKNLVRRFKTMGAIYVQERQKSGRIHYHVRFMFFDAENLPFSPSVLEKKLRQIVFEAWNKLNDGKLCREANKFYQWQTDVGYFIKAVNLIEDGFGIGRPENLWWGAFNRRLLSQHSRIPSREEVTYAIKNRPKQNAPKFKIVKYHDVLFPEHIAA